MRKKEEGSSATDSITDVTDIRKKEKGRGKKEEGRGKKKEKEMEKERIGGRFDWMKLGRRRGEKKGRFDRTINKRQLKVTG